jgi:xylitol oxidase
MQKSTLSHIATNLEAEPGQLTNWSGNIVFSAPQVYYPGTVAEVQEIVRTSEKVRVLGSKHSFNTIADSDAVLISLKEMNKVLALNKELATITVEAGARYGDFAADLHEQGFALPNLASLPHITVVGACATATHGSGIGNGNLATSVSAIEFVNAAGDLVKLSKVADPVEFYGAVVNLGALGVITNITLDLLPAFDMTQVVFRDLPMAVLQDKFKDIQARGYSVSLFTNWKNRNINEVWIKSLSVTAAAAEPELFTAKSATENLHPIEAESAQNVTEQLGVPGPWYDRLPHFKMGFKPSVGQELQSEYFLLVEHAYVAMMALEQLQSKISPHLFISEIRTIQADELWLSPCYKQTCVAFHFTWKPDVQAVMALLPLIEEQLAPFNARPHWGKLFTMKPEVLQERYPKLEEFKELIRRHDPHGKFRNQYLKILS